MNQIRRFRLVVFMGVMLACAVGLVVFFRGGGMQITDESYPKPGGSFASYSTSIRIVTNQVVDASQPAEFTLTPVGHQPPTQPFTTELTNNGANLSFDQPLQEGLYELRYKIFALQDGQPAAQYSGSYRFMVEFVALNDLPAEERGLQLAISELEEDQALSGLPIEGNDFVVKADVSEFAEFPDTIIIEMKFSLRSIEGGNVIVGDLDEYLVRLRAGRTAAFAALDAAGIDYNNYIIQYSESLLVDEFPSGREPAALDPTF